MSYLGTWWGWGHCFLHNSARENDWSSSTSLPLRRSGSQTKPLLCLRRRIRKRRISRRNLLSLSSWQRSRSERQRSTPYDSKRQSATTTVSSRSTATRSSCRTRSFSMLFIFVTFFSGPLAVHDVVYHFTNSCYAGCYPGTWTFNC